MPILLRSDDDRLRSGGPCGCRWCDWVRRCYCDGSSDPHGPLAAVSDTPRRSARSLTLQAGDADRLWALYENCRVLAEREFGFAEEAAQALVRRTRERSVHLGLQLWLAGLVQAKS